MELSRQHNAQLGLTMHNTSDVVRLVCVVFLAWLLPVTVMATAPSPSTEFHVLGIVTAIDAKHIEVKAAKGPTVSVALTNQVQFKNKSNPKSNDPPTVGDRVIIEVSKDDKKKKKVTAKVVHYSPIKNTSPIR